MKYDSRVDNEMFGTLSLHRPHISQLDEILVPVYKKLHEQDLWRMVWWEELDATLYDFLEYFHNPKNKIMFMYCVDTPEKNGNSDIVGLWWIDRYCGEFGSACAFGHVLTFREYHDGRKTLDSWQMVKYYLANGIGLKMLYSELPSRNIPARTLVDKMGFTVVGKLRGGARYNGKVCDLILSEQELYLAES